MLSPNLIRKPSPSVNFPEVVILENAKKLSAQCCRLLVEMRRSITLINKLPGPTQAIEKCISDRAVNGNHCMSVIAHMTSKRSAIPTSTPSPVPTYHLHIARSAGAYIPVLAKRRFNGRCRNAELGREQSVKAKTKSSIDNDRSEVQVQTKTGM